MSQITTELGNYVLTETGLELVTEDHVAIANTRFIVGLIQYRPLWTAGAQVFSAINARTETNAMMGAEFQAVAASNAKAEAEVTVTADFEAQV